MKPARVLITCPQHGRLSLKQGGPINKKCTDFTNLSWTYDSLNAEDHKG